MKKITYKDSGVNIEAGYESVAKIKKHVQRTFNENVLTDLGGFGGMYAIPTGFKKPVLISGTDGVGTKVLIAQKMDKHDTIGIDCVAMCVNDIICNGAKPLYFLDYIACGKNIPDRIEEIVKGISEACIESEAALIGGETAEMPDLYADDEYDLAGFAVGIVERSKVIDGSSVQGGDIIIGIPSSGVHSNGFSLVRKVLLSGGNFNLDQYISELGSTLGEELLIPTKIYCKLVSTIISKHQVKGIAHITGGGFYENIPRIVSKGLSANIYKSRIPHQPIFSIIESEGNIDEDEMYSTFNMGIGLALVIPEVEVDDVLNTLKDEKPVVLGEVVEGGKGVNLRS